MVNWKFWKWGKEKKLEEVETTQSQSTYVLKRIEGGKQIKVATLAEPTPMEELYSTLEPGTYILHEYKKGQSGFSTVWGPYNLTGEEGEGEGKKSGAKTSKKEASSLGQFVEFATSIAILKKNAAEEFAIIAPLFGFTAPGEAPKQKTAKEFLLELKDEYATLQSLFGDKTSATEPLKYKGEIPIWLHPDLLPGLIDNSMERIEKRLDRWGIIGKGADQSRTKDGLPSLPAFPQLPRSPPSPPKSDEPVKQDGTKPVEEKKEEKKE